MGKYKCSAIGDPEFINLQPNEINPFISECDIKVMYLGNNDNGTSMDREVVIDKMAKTLRGVPIIGHYIKDKKDFGGHDDLIEFNGNNIEIKDTCFNYGFVDIGAKVWFQDFEEEARSGETVVRTYVMTEGYLWTGQYPKCERVIKKGNNQSMELDPISIKGTWSTDDNTGVEFFIVNDAIFTRLCILGEDVEPCFENGSITKSASTEFSKKPISLFQMMEELKQIKQTEGQYMKNEEKKDPEKDTKVSGDPKKDEPVQEPVKEPEKDKKQDGKSAKDDEDKIKCAKDDEDKKSKCAKDEEKEEEKKKEKKEPVVKNSTELPSDFSALMEELSSLKSLVSDLKAEREEYQKKETASKERTEKEDYLKKFEGKFSKEAYAALVKESESVIDEKSVPEFQGFVKDKYIDYSFSLDKEEKSETKEKENHIDNDIPMMFNLQGESAPMSTPEADLGLAKAYGELLGE